MILVFRDPNAHPKVTNKYDLEAFKIYRALFKLFFLGTMLRLKVQKCSICGRFF